MGSGQGIYHLMKKPAGSDQMKSRGELKPEISNPTPASAGLAFANELDYSALAHLGSAGLPKVDEKKSNMSYMSKAKQLLMGKVTPSLPGVCVCEIPSTNNCSNSVRELFG